MFQVKVKFVSSNCFFFLNLINSFEDGKGNVVVDIIGYDSADILEQVKPLIYNSRRYGTNNTNQQLTICQ